MLLLEKPMTLYHGSSVTVSDPDLSRCKPWKDFGRGFYLTSSRKQAEGFARTVARRMNRRHPDSTQGYGVISVYSYRPDAELLVKTYVTAGEEWLHCVAAHRGATAYHEILEELASYDVIAGKVANDQTNATLLAYMSGIYGELGSKTADEMCVRLLMPERLDDQACFRTRRALATLSFVESERVWL